MAAGVSAGPLDFAALDGQPVRLFFLLVGPESAAGAHVKALSRISRLVRDEELRAGCWTPRRRRVHGGGGRGGSRVSERLSRWAPALAWAGVIFWLSSQSQLSSCRTR